MTTALEVRDLSKNYPLTNSQWTRFRRAVSRVDDAASSLWAVRDITFTVARGEAFGIVGANGSGKSTLLQLIAGILSPTSGSVEIRGRLSALLELGSGFAPEFTGRQNVFLNASILGLSREEINARFDAIERFAGIGAFMDQPIRTWSTGMVLRLAFAVSAHVEPEILIVDEALAVGDISFRQRCMRRIHELRASGTTILFVSHDTGDVKALCERCLWLENGTARALGEADDVVGAYLSASMQRERNLEHNARMHLPAAAPASIPAPLPAVEGSHRYGNGRAVISSAILSNPHGNAITQWTARESVVLRVSFCVLAIVAEPILGFLVRNAKGETIFGSNTARENYPLPEMAAGEVHSVDFHWVAPELAAGIYQISVAVSEGTLEKFSVCDYVEDAITVEATGGQVTRGYLRLNCAAVSVTRS